MTSVSDAAEREIELFGSHRDARASRLFGLTLDAIVRARQQGLDDDSFVPGQLYAQLEDYNVSPDAAAEYAEIVEAAIDDHEGIDSTQDLLTWRETLEDQYAYAITSAYSEGLDGLLANGCSPAEAVDYWGVEIRGFTQEDWADRRGVTQGTVQGNLEGAKEQLSASD